MIEGLQGLSTSRVGQLPNRTYARVMITGLVFVVLKVIFYQPSIHPFRFTMHGKITNLTN